MNNEQDYEILSALSSSNEPMTTYAIAKVTGITIPQVRYRVTKLVHYDVITAIATDRKTTYDTHPVLKSRESLEELIVLLTAMITLIDETQAITTDGVKKILAFIIDRIEFEDPENGAN